VGETLTDRPIRALIVNAYSVANRGDAAIVAGIVESLRRAGVGSVAVAPRDWCEEADQWRALGASAVVPPLLNVHHAPHWARRHRFLLLTHTIWRAAIAGIGAFIRASRDPAVCAYLDADIVVSAGGAYLGGPKLGTNLIKGLNIAIARLAGRHPIIAPMTITPPTRSVAAVLRLLLRGSQLFVRDTASLEVARGLGLAAYLSRDAAFRSPALSRALAMEATHRGGVDGEVVIGWSPRSYRAEHNSWRHRIELEQACLQAIAEFAGSRRARVRFIAQCTVAGDDDMDTVQRLLPQLPHTLAEEATIAEVPADLESAVEAYRGVDILLASRLHASLNALSVGVPALVIGYEPKVLGVLGGLGLGHRVIPPDASWLAETIAERLASLASPLEQRATARARVLASAGFELFDEALRRAAGSAVGQPAAAIGA
jgi:polysaccharide pyruvyl transferase WcaK-like protein